MSNPRDDSAKASVPLRIAGTRFDVLVADLGWVEDVLFVMPDDTALVSVMDPGSGAACCLGGHVLPLAFCDSNDPRLGLPVSDGFDIASFVDGLPPSVRRLVIQSPHGRSRAVGIARAICRQEGMPTAPLDGLAYDIRCERVVFECLSVARNMTERIHGRYDDTLDRSAWLVCSARLAADFAQAGRLGEGGYRV